MECLDAIMTRRSIRKFRDEPFGEGLIQSLVMAGMAAPSARNLQPWDFITVTRKSTLEALAEVIPHGKMLPRAALGLVVCGNTERSLDEDKPLFWVIDCAAAAQNVLLAAHAQGLGGVWLGVFPRADRMQGVSTLFGLPGSVVPHSVLAIGYPAEEGLLKIKYDPARVHAEGWQGRTPSR